MQKNHEDKLQPLSYVSHLLNKADRNYSVSEKEALVIVFALQKHHTIIFNYDVLICTDHRLLVALMSSTKLTGRLAQYNVKINFIEGKGNQVTDALSRNVPVECVDRSPYTKTPVP